MLRNQQIQVLTVDCRAYLTPYSVNPKADVVPEDRDGEENCVGENVLLENVDEFIFWD